MTCHKHLTDSVTQALCQTLEQDWRVRHIEVESPAQSHQGFSAARLWKVHADGQAWAARLAVPGTTAERVTEIVRVLAGTAGALTDEPHVAVPVPVVCHDGRATAPITLPDEAEPRLLRVETWLPGDPLDLRAITADSSQTFLTADEVGFVMRAVARLHAAMASTDFGHTDVLSQFGRSEAVRRRVVRLAELRRLIAQNGRTLFAARSQGQVGSDSTEMARTLEVLGEQASRAYVQHADRIGADLTNAAKLQLRCQTIHGDLWQGQLKLDEGDRVRGRLGESKTRLVILDFDAVRRDAVAGDLGRLLESLDVPPGESWTRALDQYDQARQELTTLQDLTKLSRQQSETLTPEERRLTSLLGTSTTLIAALNWLIWLRLERRPVSDSTTLAIRLNQLATRLATF